MSEPDNPPLAMSPPVPSCRRTDEPAIFPHAACERFSRWISDGPGRLSFPGSPFPAGRRVRTECRPPGFWPEPTAFACLPSLQAESGPQAMTRDRKGRPARFTLAGPWTTSSAQVQDRSGRREPRWPRGVEERKPSALPEVRFQARLRDGPARIPGDCPVHAAPWLNLRGFLARELGHDPEIVRPAQRTRDEKRLCHRSSGIDPRDDQGGIA